MAFRVEVEPQALRDLDSIAEHIRKQSSLETAQRWFNGILRTIWSLEEMPGRCQVAPESADVGQEVRLLLHGQKNRAYKIYFAIQCETPTTGIVRVFHVRHWARERLSASELEEFVEASSSEGDREVNEASDVETSDALNAKHDLVVSRVA